MKILAVQNRKGIGDNIIFLPFIKALSNKFNSPISLLVKKNSKADQYLYQTSYIDKIIFLERDNEIKNRHDGLLGSLNLIKDIKKFNFDKIIIFNSSLRYNLIAKFSGIKEVFQYPLFQKKQQHITETPKKFIKEKFELTVKDDPEIEIDDMIAQEMIEKFQIDKKEINILLGIGGSGPTKRIPANTFIKVIDKISKIKNCKFFLATGKNEEEQVILRDILSSEFSGLCKPLDDFSLREIMPLIKNCNLSICNDTSFSHLSAALGIKTITLMADTPLIYGSYNTNMHPIIPDGETTVSHNTHGKDKINPDKIYEKLLSIIN